MKGISVWQKNNNDVCCSLAECCNHSVLPSPQRLPRCDSADLNICHGSVWARGRMRNSTMMLPLVTLRTSKSGCGPGRLRPVHRIFTRVPVPKLKEAPQLTMRSHRTRGSVTVSHAGFRPPTAARFGPHASTQLPCAGRPKAEHKPLQKSCLKPGKSLAIAANLCPDGKRWQATLTDH